ncbi:21350_t:CDS:2, partial [Gigaspora margarita]
LTFATLLRAAAIFSAIAGTIDGKYKVISTKINHNHFTQVQLLHWQEDPHLQSRLYFSN